MFAAGLMDELLQRGWETRNRGKLQSISMMWTGFRAKIGGLIQ